MRYVSTSILGLALSTSLCMRAQSITTLPQNMANVEGAGRLHAPLRYTPARIQCGYSREATGWAGPKLIRALSARADTGASLSAPFSVDVQVWLSSRGCNPAANSLSFEMNHGIDKRVFIKRRTMNFAAFAQRPGRHPFDIVLRGDGPFVATTGQLLVDWATYSSQNLYNGLFDLDADRAPTIGQRGSVQHYGVACNPTSFSFRPVGINFDENFEIWSYTGSPGDYAIAWLSPNYVDIRLGGGCSIYADFGAPGALIAPFATKSVHATGLVYMRWGKFPAEMRGKEYWAQMFAISSSLQHRWSDVAQINFGTVGPRYITGHRYGVGFATTKFDPDIGPLNRGWAGQALIFKVD